MTAEQLKVIAEVIAEWDAILSSPLLPTALLNSTCRS